MAESWKDNARHSEYGGGNRGPQRRPDGTSKKLSVNEAARVERMKMMRDVPSFSEPRTQRVQEITEDGSGMVTVERPYAPDVNVIAELDERTNGYSRETRSDGA